PADPQIESLGDLLTHPNPPLDLLEAVKRWARRTIRGRNRSTASSEVASFIYFAAIAAALVRHNCRISKSDNVTLCLGFERVLAEFTAHLDLTTLMRSALQQVQKQ